ncbi:MAG: calcium-translocating P-type ATPase, PMCA-type [Prevotella sp.]|nr:calcium-translocating P-type ATPase, PMCA-type [Prevotella sp.]
MKQHYQGLTDAEVLRSREEHGANVLTPPERESLWKRFFEKLTGPFGHCIKGWHNGDSLIFILEVAAVLSILISLSEYNEWFGLHNPGNGVFFEPLGILMAILLATGISFVFELKADREFSILNQVNDEEPVLVIRNSNTQKVPRADVVVGDIIMLATGEEVPADAQLLEATSLQMDESSLTGEPMCSKTTEENHFDAEATFPSNYVMRGTKVMEGHAVAQVLSVGDATEYGRVFVAAQIDDSVKTPLNEQLDRLGKLIAKASYIVALLVVVVRIVMFFTTHDSPLRGDSGGLTLIDFITYLLQTVMIAVTLIVVAVPEGLPMAVSLSLAYSMRRMLKTNNLVRRMHACETMGAATVICTDKTGTLTQNQMQVAEVFLPNSQSSKFFAEQSGKAERKAQGSKLYENMAVNSTAQLDLTNPDRPTVLGNPTEGALLLWLRDQGIDYRQLRDQVEVLDEIPFSTERKFMATLVRSHARTLLYIKGAPEIVSICGGSAATTSNASAATTLARWQAQAMRTLSLITIEAPLPALQELLKALNTQPPLQALAPFADAEWGLVAISDPVRADVPPAVRECLDAGIQVKIVTGDTVGTAREIGRQIGLWTDADGDRNIITGPEFAALSDEELLERVADLKIIARARPMDKRRLVEALQKRGEVVAVTGDGTNDAPALKAAHVGLSMGDGTSVAKEASDITIIDNSFSSIGRAVMWGRSLYQNIQRFILFQLTVNVVACLVVLIGSFFGTESPLTVTQMLWVNLIMDTFAAMALASLPPSPAVMHDRPRNRAAFIITRPMWHRILSVGILFTILLLAILSLPFISLHLPPSNFHILYLPVSYHLSPTTFFTIFVMLQFWNMFNARAFATGRSALHLKGCKGFLMIAAIIFLGQVLIVNFGGEFFHVEPLPLLTWVIIICATSLVLWIGEVARLVSK